MDAMREIHALERRSRDVVRAAQVVPTLAVAVQEGMGVDLCMSIYNAVDARARSIKAWVDVSSGSFSVADDGEGIPADGLYKHVGECVGEWTLVSDIFQMPHHHQQRTDAPTFVPNEATSRVVSHNSDERESRDHYGQHGEFLHALGSLAFVEIESRFKDQWTAHRKVIQEGIVVFNARSKVFQKSHGTTLTVHRLFSCLPVRAKDLQSNPRHFTKQVKEIQTFCVNLSMIWPTLSFELVFEKSSRQSLRISGVTSCRERFVKMFGSAIANELKYVDFRPAGSQLGVRGYFALIQDSWEVSPAGLKQARAYYQYVFFQNQWIDSFHHECSKRITQLALALEIGIPIFVLKIDCPSTEFALLWSENGKCVEFTSLESLNQLFCEFMRTVQGSASTADAIAPDRIVVPTCDEPPHKHGEDNWSEIESHQLPDDEPLRSVQYCEQELDEGRFYAHDHGHDPLALCLPPRLEDSFLENDFDFDEILAHEEEVGDLRESYSHECFNFPDEEVLDDEIRCSRASEPQSRRNETIFVVQDAKTNWGRSKTPKRTDEDDADSLYLDLSDGVDFGTSCESCGHASAWRGNTRNEEARYYEQEDDVEYGFNASTHDSHSDESESVQIDETSVWTDGEHGCSMEEAQQQTKAPDVTDGELANVFFTKSKLPKLASDKTHHNQENPEPNILGGTSQLWLTSRSLKSELDSALKSFSPTRLSPRAYSPRQKMNDSPKKRLRQYHSKYFGEPVQVSPPATGKRQPHRAFSLALPHTSKCTLRVDNVGELKQLRQFKIPRSILSTLEVIRQVDRKFILVRVTDDNNSEGSLLLCIDQHAADERVRLERLELELFGPDGDELNVKVSTFAQPQLVRLNAKEAQTLTANEDIVRAWGFDFESLESEQTDISFFNTSAERRNDTNDGGYYVELRTTPKIDTRSANTEDFREFIQMLAQNNGYWSWTVMRPPVITRLLHSRACRSAIMFGDYLSVSQCQEIVEDLRECKLPFQCAHGRPSVVPLVEFFSRE